MVATVTYQERMFDRDVCQMNVDYLSRMAVQPSVKLNEPVSAIRREGGGVRVEHKGGVTRADYAVVTLPAHLLERIPNDFSPAKKAALKNINYLKSAKVAFEAPRFWEDEGVYGGLAWTDKLNENVIYPSNNFHSPRGVIVGAYVAGWTHQDTPDSFVKLPLAEQIRISAGSIEALHPGKSRLLEKAVAINWGQIPYSEGVGALWDGGPGGDNGRRTGAYLELLKPEGPIVFAGEHLSYVGLWQEGSALSAHGRVRSAVSNAARRKRAGAVIDLSGGIDRNRNKTVASLQKIHTSYAITEREEFRLAASLTL